MEAQYEPSLVFLSVFIAIYSAYIAFLISGRIRASSSREYSFPWLLTGAFALGGGVWAMHFVGMLAYRLPVAVGYDAAITIISVVPAILSSIIVLQTSREEEITAKTILWRSVLMGGGIGLMHYIGMLAMRMDGIMRYDLWLFSVSIVIAIVLAGLSLQFKISADKHVTTGVIFSPKLFMPSVLMGCAISGMHYIGMAAVYVFPNGIENAQALSWTPDVLAKIIVGVSILLGALLIIAIEVSHRLDLHRRLKDSESLAHLILNSTAEAIYGVNTDGNCTFVNAACVRALGYESADELLGRNMHEVTNHTRADGKRYLVENSHNHPAQLKGEEIHVDGDVFWRKDGTSFPVEYSSYPMNHEETFAGSVVTFNDVTDRKQADEALRDSQRYNRMLFEQSSIGLVLCGMNGELVDINPAYARIIGRSIKETMELTYWDITPEKYAASEQLQLESLKKTGCYGPYEKEYIHKDGHLVPVSLRGLLLEKGGETFIWSSVEDITERKQAEVELSKYREDLEELVKERTLALEHSYKELESYSYSIAHDLRAPLRSIIGFSQIVLEDASDKLNSADQGHLQRVVKSGMHMAELIDDILELSRVSRSDMQFKKVSLSTICSDLSETFNASDTERVVEWRIQPNLVVNGDPNLLYLVLHNLFGNAWKFTQQKSQALIEFGVMHEAGEKVYYVRDNGSGFDMKYVDKLFGLFQRLHRSDEYEGTGVGLTTVERIINRHNGWVRAEGEKGKGATIYFTIPENG